ncbi:MAG: glucose 1-dehydrogenase [Alphaproteobacteria bacterium]|nr:glucose 1-dehydrogenase [Alphaproteobacteria bacterium]
MRGLDGKIAVVTGGGSGIGRAISLGLVQEGAIVVIFDIDDKNASKVAQEAVAIGGNASIQHCDIADYTSVQTAVQKTEADIGPIDFLVNNAGWDAAVNFLDSDPQLWAKVIGINLMGPIHMHHVVLEKMAERGGGCVVNIASDAGRVGSSGEAVYSACKGGVIAFTKTLARELTRSGVRLNTVCPGPTDTPLFEEFKSASGNGPKIAEGLARAIPMKRLGDPSDFPGIVAFLLSDDAGYITGQTISVSGGLTMHG